MNIDKELGRMTGTELVLSKCLLGHNQIIESHMFHLNNVGEAAMAADIIELGVWGEVDRNPWDSFIIPLPPSFSQQLNYSPPTLLLLLQLRSPSAHRSPLEPACCLLRKNCAIRVCWKKCRKNARGLCEFSISAVTSTTH